MSLNQSYITLKVQRQAPDQAPFWQEYRMQAEGKTVLDALREIRDEQDSTLVFRAQCKSGICGSCAMRIQGQARLACNTFLSQVAVDDQVEVSPLLNFAVLEDLVIRDEPFWQAVESIRPWLLEQKSGHNLPRPIPVPHGSNCILCGACYAECEVQKVKPMGYAGPAGFVQAYHMLTDFRDQDTGTRLDLLEAQGLWSCSHMYNCSESCPKAIDIGEVISRSRELTLQSGRGRNPGGRHVRWFTLGVRYTGKLNEFWTLVGTRIFRIFFDIPTGLRLIRHGKIPWPWGTRSRKAGEVRNFFAGKKKQARRLARSKESKLNQESG